MSIYLLSKNNQKKPISLVPTNYYSIEINNFNQLKDSSVLIIDGLTEITHSLALYIGYAMLNEKPIILPAKLQFTTTLFMHDLIMKRSNKLILANIGVLTSDDREMLLGDLSKSRLTYTFNRHERILLKATLRKYFRELVG